MMLAGILLAWIGIGGATAAGWIFQWWPEPEASRLQLAIMLPIVILAIAFMAFWLAWIAISEAANDLRSWFGDDVGDIS